MFKFLAATVVGCLCLAPQAFSQTPAKVDFARDVQPILRQNCIGCHGPNKQNNGLRVDRRSSVLKPGTRRVIPGHIENSLMYQRLVGPYFGMPMPPTGALKPDQIAIIKAWIEQGAQWPDTLANETDLPPVNPKAVTLVEMLRTADRPAFTKAVADDPKLLNERGPEGSTPFMYAVLYTDASTLERLIKQGADVTRHNDAGATALMWAATDLEKTKVLLAHGADVNAKSDDFRTPLMVAAGKPGNAAVVKLLLSKGANTNPTSNPTSQSSPLLEAAIAGDAEMVQALLDRGADPKEIGGLALGNAAGAGCTKCIDLLMARNLDKMQYSIALSLVAAINNPALVRALIDHGADVNAPDPTGRTPLMYAAVSDEILVENVKLLIEKGAKLDTRSTHPESADTGRTALDLARFHGSNAAADLLVKAGGTSAIPIPAAPAVMRRDNTIQSAVAKSLPALQRSDASFMPKAGCFSCHNDSLAAMAVGMARKSGFRVDEKTSAQMVQMNAGSLTGARDLLHQGTLVPMINANPFIAGFVLLGLDAEGYKPDLATDAVAMYIQSHQMADGSWPLGPESRPPLCSNTIEQTVISMRVLQLYAPKVDKSAYAKSVQLAAGWISESRPKTNYDFAWKVLGLGWAGKKDSAAKARQELLALQRSDGGWSDIPTMQSGAYTTGLAMLALQASGAAVSDAAYQRGVNFLLSTQHEDGTWYVQTRAAGFQPYFDNGFPYGVDQWISSAASSLATIALELANQTPPVRTTAGNPAQR